MLKISLIQTDRPAVVLPASSLLAAITRPHIHYLAADQLGKPKRANEVTLVWKTLLEV